MLQRHETDSLTKKKEWSGINSAIICPTLIRHSPRHGSSTLPNAGDAAPTSIKIYKGILHPPGHVKWLRTTAKMSIFKLSVRASETLVRSLFVITAIDKMLPNTCMHEGTNATRPDSSPQPGITVILHRLVEPTIRGVRS